MGSSKAVGSEATVSEAAGNGHYPLQHLQQKVTMKVILALIKPLISQVVADDVDYKDLCVK